MMCGRRGGGLFGGLAEEADGVFDDAEGFGLFVDGVGFVARAEVEDAAFTDLPEATAAEEFAFVPALFEDHGIWGWDVERFVIHFGLGDIPFGGQTGGDGVEGQKGGDVGGRAIGAVGWENAMGEDEAPEIAFVGEGGGEEGVAFRGVVDGFFVEEFPLGVGAIGEGDLGEGIGFGAILH